MIGKRKSPTIGATRPAGNDTTAQIVATIVTTAIIETTVIIAITATTVIIAKAAIIATTAATDAITGETRKKTGIRSENSEMTGLHEVTLHPEIALRDPLTIIARRKATNLKTVEASASETHLPINPEANSPKFNIKNYPNLYLWTLRSQNRQSKSELNTKFPSPG